MKDQIATTSQVLKCRLLTQHYWDRGYSDDVMEGVWSTDRPSQHSPESPLPSPSQHREEEEEEEEEGEGERGGGPLVPALLSKLERLLDQVYTVYMYTYMYMYILHCIHVR